MAQKNAKIDDVKRPEKVAPSATSRPILVSGQASAPTDPMMVQEGGEKGEGESVPMTHTAKTITPPSDLAADSEPKKDDAPAPKPEADKPAAESEADEADTKDAKPEAAEAPADAPSEEKAEEPKQGASTPSERADKAKAAQETERDPDAAMSAEEAAAAEARAKREQELEALIASEKYAVPINAVQRRRSRMHSLALGLLALLLLVALVDVIADVGIISLPSSVPHTHFFSGH